MGQSGVPLGAGALGDPLRNPVYSNRIATGAGDVVPFLDFRNDQKLESIAAFVQGTYAITDSVNVTAGFRYTEDEKKNRQTVLANISPFVCEDLPLEEKWSEPTWKIGADWAIGDNAMVYGSYSRGFKSGGFNGGTCANDYDPETIDAYEIGLKTTLADNHVQLNLAAFYYDYQDFQARLFVNNASIVENAADTKMLGFEAEAVWVTDVGFEMNLGVSIMDTEYKDFLSVNPMTNLPEDASGNQVLRAPDFSFNVGAQYTLMTDSAGDFTLRYEVAYKDDYYTTVFNDDFALIKDHSLHNARLIWRNESNWEIQAFVENLTDTSRLENLLPAATVGGVLGNWAPPRTWGVEVRYTSGGY